VLRPPNPNCAVCSQSSANLQVDRQRATMRDLVDVILREKLGYGEELSIRRDSTILFDPDFEDNFSKTFAQLELQAGQVLTVADEEQDNPRVDLSLILVDG
jgi:ubiquitin-like 1-activating enzyme E1 B